MKLLNFILMMMSAHAETLQNLVEMLGIEKALAVLDKKRSEEGEFQTENLPALEEAAPLSKESFMPFDDLDHGVQKLNLPPELEDHLFSFPLYRAYIESCANLNSPIQVPGTQNGRTLVDEALAFAEIWLESLELSEPEKALLRKTSTHRWVRFRSEVLKKLGESGLEPV